MATIEHPDTPPQHDQPPNPASDHRALRMVPVSAIQIREGFNPRTTRRPEEWDRTKASVREHGILAPVLLTPTAPDADSYWLVAGEGRYRAALDAHQEHVPALIRGVDERTQGVELALLENMARDELDPVAIAHGMHRLKTAGWSHRQIAEELSVTQKFVTERLRILQLPEDLHPLIASGEIPLSAIRPLHQLVQIHPELPAVLVARVRTGKPTQTWAERLDWPTAVDDPIGALTADYHGPGCDLPPGVYNASTSFAPDELPLSDQTRDELRELAVLLGHQPDQLRVHLAREAIEQARALRAAFPTENGFAHLLVGEDVLVQVIADQVHAAITQHRERIHAAQQDPDTDPSIDPEADPDGSPESSPEQEARQRAEERRERQERQRAAQAHNHELGIAVARMLVRVRLDLPLLRVLLAVQPLDDLPGLASRGARYCLPGWPVDEATKTGKRRTRYLEPKEAGEKAREFVGGASTVGETCGRLLALIALARYADEDAIAESRRARYHLPDNSDLPWNEDIIDTLDAICADRLPDHLTAPARQQRRTDREARERDERERQAARQRVQHARGRIDELTPQERADLLADADIAFGAYSTETWELAQQLRRLDQQPDQPSSAPTSETPVEAS